MSKRDYRCPTCHIVQEVDIPLTQAHAPHIHCPHDGALMRRYFGIPYEVVINYGFRPARYPHPEDERIAQYQFENL